MSFDVFVQAFRDGAAGIADAEAVRAMLAPHISETDTSGVAQLTTADGGADVYGCDDLTSGFMANHISGAGAWDVLVEAAAASSLVVMPVGCAIALTDPATVEHLPDALRAAEIANVATGWQLVALIEGTVWACPVCFEPVLSTPPYKNWPPEDMTALSPPYEDSLGLPSYEVCPSCGFEFGNDDNPGTAHPVSFDHYREQWEKDGRQLFASGQFMPKHVPEALPVDDTPVGHDIEIVEARTGPMSRWKCTCGESSGGRRFRSPQEALKAAQRHVERRSQDTDP